jgi:hypothetical protein
LGLDGHSYSPALCERLVTLAGELHSYEQAAIAMRIAGGVTITGRHIQRLTQEVGTALAAQRDAQAEQYRRRTLPPRVPAPEVAVVEVDGGRFGTRASNAGPGVHQPQAKEDKIACLMSMRSTVHETDPQPEPPPAVRDARRVARLVEQLHGKTPAQENTTENPREMAARTPAADDVAAARHEGPQRVVRTCVASLCDSRAFALLVAAEAQERGFFETGRQAFLGDGQRYNWWIQRAYFPDFVPIADFLHVLAYLYVAAYAVHRDAAAQWSQYEQWMRACWQGRVGEVIADLQRWQQCLGPAPPAAAADDPRQVMYTTLGYLCNNRTRMDYPRYRRLGLPVTSSLVESLVGEFNARVKSRAQWWNRPAAEEGTAGAEAILQVRAAVLSEDGRLRRYFAERRGHAYRRHQPARRPQKTVAA